MKKNIILFLVSLVGIISSKAQGLGGTHLDCSESVFTFTIPASNLFDCSFAPMNTNANGFYFKKPIIGGNIIFNVIREDGMCEWQHTGDISFKVNGNTKLFVNGEHGYVGVNTTNPQRQFDVNGEIGAKGLFVTHTGGAWSYASLIQVSNVQAKAFVVENTTTNTTVFSILGSGCVNAKKIFTEEITVNSNAMNMFWPDYVFNKDYKLMSLHELEQFIKTNKHLPEIPSTKEVEENGINLGDIQAKLLLKVEELTLHIINLQKQIDELKQTKGGEK